MKQETLDRIKKDFPIMFTATIISLLSSTLYYNNPQNLFSKEVFSLVGNVFIWSLIASGIIFGFYISLVKISK